MKPVPFSQADLAAVLRNMADLVEAGDSFEGSIEYSMPIEGMEECGSCGAHLGPSGTFVWHYPDEDCRAVRPPFVPDDTYAMVMASYRIGNSMGQGGLRTIGEM